MQPPDSTHVDVIENAVEGLVRDHHVRVEQEPAEDERVEQKKVRNVRLTWPAPNTFVANGAYAFIAFLRWSMAKAAVLPVAAMGPPRCTYESTISNVVREPGTAMTGGSPGDGRRARSRSAAPLPRYIRKASLLPLFQLIARLSESYARHTVVSSF